MARQSTQWNLVVEPNRMGALIAIGGAWGIGALIAWMVSIDSPADTPGWLGWIVGAPFALVITYYGLRTWRGGSGNIALTPQGFAITRPEGNVLEYDWDAVEAFFIDKAFPSPTHEGIDAPHFRLIKDGTVEWLPQNNGFAAADIVAIMEGARRLALAGWPITPRRLSELSAWSGKTHEVSQK